MVVGDTSTVYFWSSMAQLKSLAATNTKVHSQLAVAPPGQTVKQLPASRTPTMLAATSTVV